MPDEIMVASWRVMIVSSAALTRLTSVISIWKPVFFSFRSMTVRPWAFSSAMTASFVAPTISPVDGNAGGVDRLVGEGRGGHQAASAPVRRARCVRPVDWTSLRSSAGSEERVSASAIVILPSRTRPASEASIVCMPYCPPVWMSE